MNNSDRTVVMAGIPAGNAALYHQIRFLVGDPTAFIQFGNAQGSGERLLILRDIEMQRAKQKARVDQVHCPADFAPAAGLSGDRETATAQSVAECLRQRGVKQVFADRSLPLIYADQMQRAGIHVECDLDLGVLDRRAKDEQEIAWIREAQQATEGAMEMACRLVANASARADGILLHDGEPLTSERVRAEIDQWLLQRGYSNPPSIVACGPIGADCHDHGSGPLRTGQPVIIDIFPQNQTTRYNGDCTRTVVHGTPPDALLRMHKAVVEAKLAAEAITKSGVTGEEVHLATSRVIQAHGYHMGLPSEDAPPSYCGMTHGTGHGLGLEVHEPPLLDFKGPPLVAGDVLTIEPGLYCRDLGGVRVEDMVVVHDDGCENLNQLPFGLNWNDE